MKLFGKRGKADEGAAHQTRHDYDEESDWPPLPDFPPDEYARGVMACPRCRCRMPLKDLKPLRMVNCPQCRASSFVPMRINRFWLFQPLGGGGMGSVYKAYDISAPGEVFAAKVLFRTGADTDVSVEALLNESEVGKIIGDHSGLVKCVASGQDGEEFFSVMEYVEGKRLDNLIRWRGRLGENHVIQLALQVVAAEKHIYECGYLYRDLKPENIIITRDGAVKLLDYGLCLTRDAALRMADEYVAGSPYYMPPERLWGIGEDGYSEIYSLGMVMYYGLTGRTFFDSDEVESLAKRHVSKIRLTPAAKMRGFRPELVEVLTRMIKQDYRERYLTFEELEAALSDLLR